MSDTRDWSDSDVFANKVFSGKIVEYISVLKTLIFVIFLVLSLFFHGSELLYRDCVHSLEDFGDVIRFLMEDWVVDKSSELGVDSLGPSGDLVVDDVDFLEFLIKESLVILLVSQLFVHLDDLLVEWTWVSLIVLLGISIRVDLQLVKSSSKLFIIFLDLVDLSLTLRYSNQKGAVGLLSGQEFSNHLLYIVDNDSSLNSLEGIVDLLGVSHFLLHLVLNKDVIHFLDVKIFSHSKLR